MGREFMRKARTLGGNWQVFLRMPCIFLPWRPGRLIAVTCHRVLRVKCPFMLLAMLVLNVALVVMGAGVFYTAFLCAQALFYVAAALGAAFKLRGPGGWPWTFVVFQAAAAWGYALFITGGLGRKWRKTAASRD